MREEIIMKAQAAKDKKSAYGNDIDLDMFAKQVPPRERITSLMELSQGVKERALGVGVDASMKDRSGSFFQHDQSVVFSASTIDGLELMDINDALKKYDWLQDYFFTASSWTRTSSRPTALVHPFGYFISALPGAKIVFPLQACLYMGRENMIQNVHNIIIAEEGSELHIITGCTTDTHVRPGCTSAFPSSTSRTTPSSRSPWSTTGPRT